MTRDHAAKAGELMRFGSIACLVLCVSAVFSPAASAEAKADQTGTRLAISQQKLDDFYSTRSLDDLQAAIDPLARSVDIASIEPQNYVAQRRAVVEAWARLFQAIESSYDPPSYPNPRFSCPAPGREPDGRQLYPCVDPNDIPDRTVRTAYIAALHEYGLKVKHANYQARLHLLDDDAMFYLDITLSNFRAVAPSDSPALDSILQKADISGARRQKIDAMIQGSQVH